MKIVVLDGHAMNPGDLSWDDMRNLGEFDIYDRCRPEDVVPRAKDADIIVTNKVKFDRKMLEKLPNLKMISVLATGYNIIDTKAAAERGIVVSNVPAYSTDSVAQMVFAFILEFCFHVQEHSDTVKEGKWSMCRDFCYWNYSLIELKGKTLGIIGYGSIGKAVEKIALAFNMNVLKCASVARDGMNTLEQVLRESDFVSVHCPLTDKTYRLINRETLSMMKKTAYLINTSRGSVVDDEALAEFLNNDKIAGAAMDVLSDIEPPAPTDPLLTAKNCIITPHIAWASIEARLRLMNISVNNVKSFIEGHPINKVN